MSKITSRRAVLAGIAAVPAIAAPTIAAAAIGERARFLPSPAYFRIGPDGKEDPIFAVIYEHLSLDEQQFETWCQLQDSEEGSEAEAGLKAAHKTLCNAKEATAATFASTRPTTAAGAGALVAYVHDDMEDGETNWHRPALANAARALGATPH